RLFPLLGLQLLNSRSVAQSNKSECRNFKRLGAPFDSENPHLCSGNPIRTGDIFGVRRLSILRDGGAARPWHPWWVRKARCHQRCLPKRFVAPPIFFTEIPRLKTSSRIPTSG